MILGTACLDDRALDGEAIRAALDTVGLDEALLVVGGSGPGAALAGVPAAAVRAPAAERASAVDVARRVRAARLVIELPADAELEPTCRELFALARAHPGLPLAVATPAEGPLAAPDALRLVVDDLAAQGLGYWHRPATAHRLGQADAAWLDALGRRLAGVSLDDVAGGESGLPPGLGEVDFAPLAEQLSPSVPVALDLGPVAEVALLRLAVQTLRGLGFS